MTERSVRRLGGLGLVLLGFLTPGGAAPAAAEPPLEDGGAVDARRGPPPPICRPTCDRDGDGDVDLLDLRSIVEPGDRPAAPGEAGDADADGWIDARDAARCSRACTLPGCAIPPRDHRPVADAGPDQGVLPGSEVTLDGSASSDLLGHALRYRWKLVERPHGSKARLSDRWAVRPTFVADREGEYVARLVVDDCRRRSAPDEVTVVTTPGNVPPVADAGPDQTVPRGTFVALDGSGSSDADGDPLVFAWSLVTTPAGSAAALDDPGSVTPGFLADLPGDYAVELVVEDGLAASVPDSVRITTVSSPPAADAGPDQTVLAADTVTLDGGGSSDADGDPLSFRWSLLFRPAGSSAVLSDPAAVAPTFVADLPGVYVAQLIVHDGFEDSAPDTVTITAQEPVEVTVEATDPDAAEAGPTPGAFTFTRTGDPAAPLTVVVARGGTADDGADYASLGGATFAVTFPAGDAATTVTVTPLADNRLEGDETVALTIQPGTDYVVGTPGTATVTIADDPPVVTVTASDPDASEAGPEPGVFTVARSGGDPGGSFTVQLDVTGTAANNGDFLFVGGSLTFPAGEATADLVITPRPDSAVEGPETVIVTIEPSPSYLIGSPATATVTIADDPAVVTAVATDPDASEAGLDPGEITFTRSGGDLGSVLQIVVARGGTATNGLDYAGIGGSSFLVAFAAGETSAAVTITPLDDALVEGTETVVLTIQPRAAYAVGAPGAATVTLTDDD